MREIHPCEDCNHGLGACAYCEINVDTNYPEFYEKYPTYTGYKKPGRNDDEDSHE
jgi:hypothetical protein